MSNHMKAAAEAWDHDIHFFRSNIVIIKFGLMMMNIYDYVILK